MVPSIDYSLHFFIITNCTHFVLVVTSDNVFFLQHNFHSFQIALGNSEDLEQTGPGAVCSESSLFSILSASLERGSLQFVVLPGSSRYMYIFGLNNI